MRREEDIWLLRVSFGDMTYFEILYAIRLGFITLSMHAQLLTPYFWGDRLYVYYAFVPLFCSLLYFTQCQMQKHFCLLTWSYVKIRHFISRHAVLISKRGYYFQVLRLLHFSASASTLPKAVFLMKLRYALSRFISSWYLDKADYCWWWWYAAFWWADMSILLITFIMYAQVNNIHFSAFMHHH